MHSTHDVSHDLASLGEVCARMGSPFFGALLAQAAAAYQQDAVFADLLDRHAHRSRLGLRLGGAAHFRALRGEAPTIATHYPSTGGDGDARAAWQAVLADVHAHLDPYDALLAREVQTNEVARAMPVLGAMLALAADRRMPLRIFEIGSSAGLVLNFDYYYYAGDGWTWGDAASTLHLHNRNASGAPLHLDAPLHVVERRGCDLHPLNAANDEDADTLLCFIWPDQHERFARLRAAIEIARRHPVEIAQGDGIAWAREAARPTTGTITVLLHTVMVEHLTRDGREALQTCIDELARGATPSAPFAWVRMEIVERSYETRVTHWPGEEETLIALSDGHAQNLRWHGALGEGS
jgi:hypothetical protein